MRVTISIVSFNTKDFLRDCLLNLLQRNYQNEVSFWVLDNNSSDGSAQMVESEFPKVNLIKSNVNLGFAKGHNIIFKKSQDDFVVLLNPDTRVSAEDIDEMVRFMQAHPQCGVASCRLSDFNNNLQSNGGDLPFGLSLISWLFNIDVLWALPIFHNTKEKYYQAEREVGWVGGTFTIIRKTVLEKVGFLNEDYFMYFEDVDFCYKVKKMGFSVMLNPRVLIKHFSGASSKDPKLAQWTGEFKGLILFYKKEFGFLPSLIVRLLIYIAIILRILVFGLIGKIKIALTYGKVLVKI